ncbi:enoyl-ACP reductase FabI [Cerasicoccus arenae]|uniref:Enoyl-[acyl-carrier-protein] reductase [NADH] n=1 Tax=Cerasicoccus arenae TaxID=424488 RepID=A0A8J3DBD5_9BACT|nr:SDR family oxidoreductase [Cerasicoccus arenae]MBK1857291.1 SDR family oxidoreductase [Cerasicoccus arenae]GHC00496.1 enoyl-[acyl-carrier-protein] reductase [NADH] [Cerasicoccus arenae]
MSFLDFANRRYLIFGVANRKSVAWAIGQTLEREGAEVVYSVRSEARRGSLAKLMGDRPMHICDVEREDEITALAESLKGGGAFDGIVHAIAYANYSAGIRPFHETERADFLQATAISSFSLVEISRAFKPLLKPDASVVAIGISSQVLAENYGYMSPIKAALESSSRFLAKSFSADTQVRFNTVNAGPLKTSASAGIPGYLENYLFAEKLTLRGKAITTQEVANAAVFLLSPASSGINAQSIVVNQGMDLNYFEKSVVSAATKL